jgi:hypothetical protein
MANVYKKQINFKANPYRGIFSKIAVIESVSPQAIHQSWRKNNPRIVQLVKNEIKKVQQIVNG